jgi:hypothetical protein
MDEMDNPRESEGGSGSLSLADQLGLTDHEILQREFIDYEARFAECQRRVSAVRHE